MATINIVSIVIILAALLLLQFSSGNVCHAVLFVGAAEILAMVFLTIIALNTRGADLWALHMTFNWIGGATVFAGILVGIGEAF
jgi:hypothetical protein